MPSTFAMIRRLVIEYLNTIKYAHYEPSRDHAIMFILQRLHIKQTCFSSFIMNLKLATLNVLPSFLSGIP